MIGVATRACKPGRDCVPGRDVRGARRLPELYWPIQRRWTSACARPTISLPHFFTPHSASEPVAAPYCCPASDEGPAGGAKSVQLIAPHRQLVTSVANTEVSAPGKTRKTVTASAGSDKVNATISRRPERHRKPRRSVPRQSIVCETIFRGFHPGGFRFVKCARAAERESLHSSRFQVPVLLAGWAAFSASHYQIVGNAAAPYFDIDTVWLKRSQRALRSMP